MKKISVEVEELLNPKLSLTQEIVLIIQKEKNPITSNELYDKLPNYSQRGIRAILNIEPSWKSRISNEEVMHRAQTIMGKKIRLFSTEISAKKVLLQGRLFRTTKYDMNEPIANLEDKASSITSVERYIQNQVASSQAMTGVERYIQNQSSTGLQMTSVERYIQNQVSAPVSNVMTSVDRYIQNQAKPMTGVEQYIQNKAKISSTLTGVAQYILNNS